MMRNTVEFGIDLGTTNSAVAVMSHGKVEVVRNNVGEEITPSAVRILSNGAVVVGRSAYQHLRLHGNRDAADQFKPDMGKVSKRYVFAEAGREASAEELSAEVLKSLRGDAEAWAGESVSAAVITVPAAFELAQSEATGRAAASAGLEYSPLLQEPIAAGLAYGYDKEGADAHFAVFDLGGGTFDTTLLRINGNRLSVVDHDGDNHLGGRHWDRYLADLLNERLVDAGFDLDFGEADRALEHRRVITAFAEDEKKRLSRSEAIEVVFDGALADAGGRPIEASVRVTRAEFVGLIGRDVDRAVELTETMLERHGDLRSSVTGLVLAGGPTYTPHVRESLQRLGIPLETRLDPMTVVARGAAVFAAGAPLRRDTAAAAPTEPGVEQATLSYPGVSDDLEATVGARFESDSLVRAVELRRADGGWISPRIPVTDGAFMVRVVLEPHRTSVFEITAFSDDGGRVRLNADRLAITHGLAAAAPPISRTLSVVALTGADEESIEPMLPKGSPLPAVRERTFRTVRALKPGDDSAALDVHVVEGESPRAENNRHVGYLRIEAKDIDDELPAGTPIEIKLRVDESRGVVAQAYIPLVDFRKENVLTDKYVPEVDVALVEGQLAEAVDRARQVAGDRTASLERIEQTAAEIETDLTAEESVDRAERRLKELRDDIERLASETQAERLVKQVADELADTRGIVSEHGDAQDRVQFDALEAETERAVASRDVTRMTRAVDELRRMYFKVLYAQPWFWVDYFIDLSEQAQTSSRAAEFRPMIDRGRAALDQQDIDALRRVCEDLWDMLPREEQEASGLANIGIRV